MAKLQEVLQLIQAENMRAEFPDIRVGDLLRIGVSIQEGNKKRIQPFEGTVIAKHQVGADSTVTVRKNLQGVGVERVFPIYAPCIADIQILRRAQVSRAKLYYLRTRTGKATRLKEKFQTLPPVWANPIPIESPKTSQTPQQTTPSTKPENSEKSSATEE